MLLRYDRQELVGPAIEEAVLVNGVIVIGRPGQRPILTVDPADEALERVGDFGAGLKLVEKTVKERARHS